MSFTIEIYEKENGDIPLEIYLNSIDKKMQAKILKAIDLLEENGNRLREPASKALSDGIFELRIVQGSNISRVLYFFFIDKKIVLTHGFTKKTSKTPRKEIEKALNYRNDWLRRNVDELQRI